MQKQTHTKKNFLKNQAHSLANDRGAKPVTFQQDTTNGHTPQDSKGNKLRLVVGTGINLIERGFLDAPLITLPIPH